MARGPNRRRRTKALRNQDGERRHPCAGKKRYEDIEVATKAAAGLVLSGRAAVGYVYICPRGTHYHVSSRTSRTWVRKIEQEQAP